MPTLRDIIAAAAAEAGTPEIAPLMHALGGQESGGSTDSTIVNKDSGARGPFQVMPATARMYGFKGSDAELQDPEVNARYAAKKIADDYKRYNGNISDVIAAYYQGDNKRGSNGGYAAPAKGDYPSTDDYVKQVQSRLGGTPSMADAIGSAVDQPSTAMAEGNGDIDKLVEWLKTQQSQPQIEELYNKAIQQNDETQAPEMRPVPKPVGLAQRLLSTFSGGLATNVTRNPQYLAGANASLEDVQGKHDYAEEANARTKANFVSEREARKRALQDKLFEHHLGNLLDAGETEKALKLMNTKASIEARYKKEAAEQASEIKGKENAQKLKDWLARDTNKEEERRKTVRMKADEVVGQTKMPEAEKIAMQKALDATLAEFKSRRDQTAVMQGGEGLTEETFHQLAEEEQAQVQKILDAYLRKYPKTTAEGANVPTTPVIAPQGASPGSTTSVPGEETPQQKVTRIAREIQAQKAKK